MDKYEVIPITLSQGEGEGMVLACSLSKGLAFQGRRGEDKGEGYNLKGYFLIPKIQYELGFPNIH